MSLICSFLIMSRLVLSTALLRLLAGSDLSFKDFGQGPCLALVCQGGDEGVDELSFGFDGDVFQELCKLAADIVCFLALVLTSVLNRPSAVNMLLRYLNSVPCWS